MIVYKAVAVHGRGEGRILLSLFANSPWTKSYIPGYPAKGNWGSKLFAFDTLEHAQEGFTVHNMEIWEAEAPDARPTHVAPGLAEIDLWFDWWQNSVTLISYMGMPVGTVLCSELTLLTKVRGG